MVAGLYTFDATASAQLSSQETTDYTENFANYTGSGSDTEQTTGQYEGHLYYSSSFVTGQFVNSDFTLDEDLQVAQSVSGSGNLSLSSADGSYQRDESWNYSSSSNYSNTDSSSGVVNQDDSGQQSVVTFSGSGNSTETFSAGGSGSGSSSVFSASFARVVDEEQSGSSSYTLNSTGNSNYSFDGVDDQYTINSNGNAVMTLPFRVILRVTD